MYRLLVAVAVSQALQPRPKKTLDAVKRRDLLPLAGILFAPPAANAATSAELKAMMGGLQSELSDENLAKARGVAQKDDGGGFGIELPSVKAPSFAPKEGKPKPKPKAKQASSGGAAEVSRIEVPDVAGGFGDFGAAQREAGRKRAEAMRNRAFSPEREKEEMKPAPADSSEVASGAVYDELRAKREAQRAAMEAREEQRKFNRLTPAEQAKYRAAGKAPKGK